MAQSVAERVRTTATGTELAELEGHRSDGTRRVTPRDLIRMLLKIERSLTFTSVAACPEIGPQDSFALIIVERHVRLLFDEFPIPVRVLEIDRSLPCIVVAVIP